MQTTPYAPVARPVRAATTNIIDLSIDKLMEHKIREQQMSNVQKRKPVSLFDPLLNLRVRDYYRSRYEQTAVNEIAGRTIGSAEGATLGAGMLASIAALALTIISPIPGDEIAAITAMAGTIMKTSATVGAVAGGVGGAIASDYTTYYASRDLAKGLFTKGEFTGEQLNNWMRFTGQTLDQASISTIIKSSLLGLIKQEDVTEIIKQSYGLSEKGRIDMDFSLIRESMGIDLGGVGNFIFDFTGEFVTDIGSLASIGKTITNKGSIKVLEKAVQDSSDVVGAVAKTLKDKKSYNSLIRAISRNNVEDAFILLTRNGQKFDKEVLTKFIDSVRNSALKDATYRLNKIFTAYDAIDDTMSAWVRRISSPYLLGIHATKQLSPKLNKFIPDSVKEFFFGNNAKYNKILGKNMSIHDYGIIKNRQVLNFLQFIVGSNSNRFCNELKELFPEEFEKIYKEIPEGFDIEYFLNDEAAEPLRKKYKEYYEEILNKYEKRIKEINERLKELDSKKNKLKEDIVEGASLEKEYRNIINNKEYNKALNSLKAINNPKEFILIKRATNAIHKYRTMLKSGARKIVKHSDRNIAYKASGVEIEQALYDIVKYITNGEDKEGLLIDFLDTLNGNTSNLIYGLSLSETEKHLKLFFGEQSNKLNKAVDELEPEFRIRYIISGIKNILKNPDDELRNKLLKDFFDTNKVDEAFGKLSEIINEPDVKVRSELIKNYFVDQFDVDQFGSEELSAIEEILNEPDAATQKILLLKFLNRNKKNSFISTLIEDIELLDYDIIKDLDYEARLQYYIKGIGKDWYIAELKNIFDNPDPRIRKKLLKRFIKENFQRFYSLYDKLNKEQRRGFLYKLKKIINETDISKRSIMADDFFSNMFHHTGESELYNIYVKSDPTLTQDYLIEWTLGKKESTYDDMIEISKIKDTKLRNKKLKRLFITNNYKSTPIFNELDETSKKIDIGLRNKSLENKPLDQSSIYYKLKSDFKNFIYNNNIKDIRVRKNTKNKTFTLYVVGKNHSKGPNKLVITNEQALQLSKEIESFFSKSVDSMDEEKIPDKLKELIANTTLAKLKLERLNDTFTRSLGINSLKDTTIKRLSIVQTDSGKKSFYKTLVDFFNGLSIDYESLLKELGDKSVELEELISNKDVYNSEQMLKTINNFLTYNLRVNSDTAQVYRLTSRAIPKYVKDITNIIKKVQASIDSGESLVNSLFKYRTDFDKLQGYFYNNIYSSLSNIKVSEKELSKIKDMLDYINKYFNAVDETDVDFWKETIEDTLKDLDSKMNTIKDKLIEAQIENLRKSFKDLISSSDSSSSIEKTLEYITNSQNRIIERLFGDEQIIGTVTRSLSNHGITDKKTILKTNKLIKDIVMGKKLSQQEYSYLNSVVKLVDKEKYFYDSGSLIEDCWLVEETNLLQYVFNYKNYSDAIELSNQLQGNLNHFFLIEKSLEELLQKNDFNVTDYIDFNLKGILGNLKDMEAILNNPNYSDIPFNSLVKTIPNFFENITRLRNALNLVDGIESGLNIGPRGVYSNYSIAISEFIKLMSSEENNITTENITELIKTINSLSNINNKYRVIKNLDISDVIYVKSGKFEFSIHNKKLKGFVTKIINDDKINYNKITYEELLARFEDLKSELNDVSLDEFDEKDLEIYNKLIKEETLKKVIVDNYFDPTKYFFDYYNNTNSFSTFIHKSSGDPIKMNSDIKTRSFVLFDTENGGEGSQDYSIFARRYVYDEKSGGFTIVAEKQFAIRSDKYDHSKISKEVDRLNGGKGMTTQRIKDLNSRQDSILFDDELQMYEAFRSFLEIGDIVCAHNAKFDFGQVLSKLSGKENILQSEINDVAREYFDFNILDSATLASLFNIYDAEDYVNELIANVDGEKFVSEFNKSNSITNLSLSKRLKDKVEVIERSWLDDSPIDYDENRSTILIRYQEDGDPIYTYRKKGSKEFESIHIARTDVDVMSTWFLDMLDRLDNYNISLDDLDNSDKLYNNVFIRSYNNFISGSIGSSLSIKNKDEKYIKQTLKMFFDNTIEWLTPGIGGDMVYLNKNLGLTYSHFLPLIDRELVKNYFYKNYDYFLTELVNIYNNPDNIVRNKLLKEYKNKLYSEFINIIKKLQKDTDDNLLKKFPNTSVFNNKVFSNDKQNLNYLIEYKIINKVKKINEKYSRDLLRNHITTNKRGINSEKFTKLSHNLDIILDPESSQRDIYLAIFSLKKMYITNERKSIKYLSKVFGNGPIDGLLNDLDDIIMYIKYTDSSDFLYNELHNSLNKVFDLINENFSNRIKESFYDLIEPRFEKLNDNRSVKQILEQLYTSFSSTVLGVQYIDDRFALISDNLDTLLDPRSSQRDIYSAIFSLKNILETNEDDLLSHLPEVLKSGYPNAKDFVADLKKVIEYIEDWDESQLKNKKVMSALVIGEPLAWLQVNRTYANFNIISNYNKSTEIQDLIGILTNTYKGDNERIRNFTELLHNKLSSLAGDPNYSYIADKLNLIVKNFNEMSSCLEWYEQFIKDDSYVNYYDFISNITDRIINDKLKDVNSYMLYCNDRFGLSIDVMQDIIDKLKLAHSQNKLRFPDAKFISQQYHLIKDNIITFMKHTVMETTVDNKNSTATKAFTDMYNDVIELFEDSINTLRAPLIDISTENKLLKHQMLTLHKLNEISHISKSTFDESPFKPLKDIEFDEGIHTLYPSEAVSYNAKYVVKGSKRYQYNYSLKSSVNKMCEPFFKERDSTYKALPITDASNSKLVELFRFCGDFIGLGNDQFIYKLSKYDSFSNFQNKDKYKFALSFYDDLVKGLIKPEDIALDSTKFVEFVSRMNTLESSFPYLKNHSEFKDTLIKATICSYIFNFFDSTNNTDNLIINDKDITEPKVLNKILSPYIEDIDTSSNLFNDIKGFYKRPDGSVDIKSFRNYLVNHKEYNLVHIAVEDNKPVFRRLEEYDDNVLSKVLTDDSGLYMLMSKDSYIKITNTLQPIIIKNPVLKALKNNVLRPMKLLSLFNLPFIIQNITSASFQNMASNETTGDVNMFSIIGNLVKTSKNYHRYIQLSESFMHAPLIKKYLGSSLYNFSDWIDLLDNDDFIYDLSKSTDECDIELLKKITKINSDEELKDMLINYHKYSHSVAAYGEVNDITRDYLINEKLKEDANNAYQKYNENYKDILDLDIDKYHKFSTFNNKVKEAVSSGKITNEQAEEVRKLHEIYSLKKYNNMSSELLKEQLENINSEIETAISNNTSTTILNRHKNRIESILNERESGNVINNGILKALKWYFDINNNIETIVRIAAIEQYLDAGMSYDRATYEVISRQFIYNNKAMAEQMAEFVVPFISYPMRMASLVEDLVGNYSTMKLLYIYDSLSWKDKGSENSSYLTRRRARGDTPIGNKLVGTTNPIKEGMMGLTDFGYSFNNKVNPLAKPIIDLATGSQYNRWNQLPGVSIAYNAYTAIRDKNVLQSLTNDYYRYSQFSNLYLPRVNNRIGGSLYNRLYTKKGYSRITMNMQPLNSDNLKYRVNSVMKYSGPYRNRQI